MKVLCLLLVLIGGLMMAVKAEDGHMGLIYDHEFNWKINFGNESVPPGIISVGAEGMCIINGNPPRLFAMAHSRTYLTGVLQELDWYTGDVIQTIWLDNRTLVYIEQHERIAGDVYYVFASKDFTGCTVNMEGNIVLMGKTLSDEEPPQVQNVMFFINPDHPEYGILQGPVSVEAPLVTPSDVAFDPTWKTYWVVDRDTNAIYEEVITCCEEQNWGHLRRWVQQLRMKKVFGTEFGLLGNNNIFSKRDVSETEAEAETEKEEGSEEITKSLTKRTAPLATQLRAHKKTFPEEGWDGTPIPADAPLPNYLRYISVPGFGDPEGIDIDPVTGNLFVLNDAPTTVLYEMTPWGEVVDFWQLEQMTSYNDANSVAVTEDWVIVGFDDEGKIIFFKRENNEVNDELISRKH